MTRAVLLTLAVLGAMAGCARRETANDTPDAAAAPPAASEPAPAPAMESPAAPPTDTPPETAAVPPDEAPAPCDAEPAQRFVGQAYTVDLGEEARIAAGAGVVRALRPGEIVTMEFQMDRLSLTLDESGRISRVACG
jgi:Peptidase inhibitor I78 family